MGEGMLFCKDCGVALGIFGKDQREYCAACVQRHRPQPLPPSAVSSGDVDLLADAALSLENGKMVLRSKEGWELWSGGSGMRIELKTLFSQARRIYAIRLRRQKN
jgi:hypothetical protein